MKVQLTANLGTLDCKALRIDFEDATEGEIIDVKTETATVLFKRGIAVEVKEDPKPAKPPVAPPTKGPANG